MSYKNTNPAFIAAMIACLTGTYLHAIEPVRTKIFIGYNAADIDLNDLFKSKKNDAPADDKIELLDLLKDRDLSFGIQFGGSRIYGGFTVYQRKVKDILAGIKSIASDSEEKSEDKESVETTQVPSTVDKEKINGDSDTDASEASKEDMIALADPTRHLDFFIRPSAFLGFRFTDNISLVFRLRDGYLAPGLGISFFDQSLNFEVMTPNLLNYKNLKNYKLNNFNIQIRLAIIPVF